jgi:alpha-beta hydrolase superfamily lysophospholipase
VNQKRSPLKTKISPKIYFSIVIAVVVVAISYLMQRPFKPALYRDYEPQWNTNDLASLQANVDKKEKSFSTLRKDNEKKIGFHEGPTPTNVSMIYIPGFSATRKEIFPVVESLAKQFSANYFLSRFPAHGQDPLDYKNITAQGFFDTTYEALEIANKLGKKKIFIGTSTGAALISAALVQGADIDAAVLIAPAFQVYPSNSWLLSTRLGPVFNALFIDEIRSWTPKNPAMSLYWNTSHHRNGLIALLQSVEYIRSLDFSVINKPVLMLYTKNDTVVVNEAILAKFAEIKDPRKRLVEIPASSHVLAGEFTSPETTELVIKEIHDWLQSLVL